MSAITIQVIEEKSLLNQSVCEGVQIFSNQHRSRSETV